MPDLLKSAIENNIALYEAVFTSHGIPFVRDRSWYSDQLVPPLYSNLITLMRSWRPDKGFDRISGACKHDLWESWTLKDSYGDLDLTPIRFTRLFEGYWMAFEKAIDVDTTADTQWSRVNTAEELNEWNEGWNVNENLVELTFRADLLDNPSMSFLLCRKDSNLVGGCIVVTSVGVHGISNYFGLDGTSFIDLTTWIKNTIGLEPIVLYARLELAIQLERAGFV